MKKIRLAFDPDGLWDKKEFRDVVKAFVLDTENYEVYLITMSTDNSFLISVLAEAGMDSSKMFQVADKDYLLAKLELLQIRLYLDSNNRTVMFIDAMSQYAHAIFVDSGSFDGYKMQLRWITSMQFWLSQIKKEDGYSTQAC